VKRWITSLAFLSAILAANPARSQTAEISDCPTEYSFNHCGIGMIDFDATGVGQIFFELVSGPGIIDPTSGIWAWTGDDIPISGTDQIEVRAVDDNGAGESCTVSLEITNRAPTVACPPPVVVMYSGETRDVEVPMGDPDGCDNLTVSVVYLTNGDPGDLIEVSGSTVSFTPSNTGHGRIVTITVEVSDGDLTTLCDLEFAIICCYRPPSILIEVKEDQFQGQFTNVDVVLHGVDRTQGLGGFELLFAYDASVLSMPSAVEGEVYTECEWEYFTYRDVSNCGGACPSGLFRVIGVANLNDGPNSPGCDSPDMGYVQSDQLPISLFSLRFLVTNDRTYECQFAPIKFFWIECGDNAISNHDGSILSISDKVFDYVSDIFYPFQSGEITGDGTQAFPTHQGAPNDCVNVNEQQGKIAARRVDFQNGGIGIICSADIDARGDINQNNIAFEIADAIMLTNYFLIGLPAFYGHPEGSIAASDTNADGLPLTVGDLVYLIQVVIGEISPFPR
jgi:hypothetical protein